MNSHKKILLISTLLIIIAVGGYFIFSSPDNNNEENKIAGFKRSSNLAEERNNWSKYIDKFGAEKAYAEFKKEYAPLHFGIQHSAAHLIGELLYEKLGIKGITTCDATFAFGCYHSFFGRALSENGITIVEELDKACVQEYGPLGTGCMHGIGHGLVEYFSSKELLKALDACELTTQIKELFGCTSGVFMEYNVPIVFDESNARTVVRELNPDNPHEPCNTIVPERFRNSCYYEIGQWWDKVFKGNYEKMGLLCKEAKDTYKEACYIGVGNLTAPTSNYNVQAAINKCLMMPNANAELLCRSGASWSFFSVPEQREFSHKLCEGLVDEKNKLCAQKADLISEKDL